VIKKAAQATRRVKMQVKYRPQDGLRRSQRDPGLYLACHRPASSAIVGAVYIRFAQFSTEMVKTDSHSNRREPR
jgi:hypothetical protein